jgi:hypothetical protein
MQRAVQVPQVFVITLIGLVIIFVVSSESWAARRAKWRVEAGPDEPTIPEPTGSPGAETVS